MDWADERLFPSPMQPLEKDREDTAVTQSPFIPSEVPLSLMGNNMAKEACRRLQPPPKKKKKRVLQVSLYAQWITVHTKGLREKAVSPYTSGKRRQMLLFRLAWAPPRFLKKEIEAQGWKARFRKLLLFAWMQMFLLRFWEKARCTTWWWCFLKHHHQLTTEEHFFFCIHTINSQLISARVMQWLECCTWNWEAWVHICIQPWSLQDGRKKNKSLIQTLASPWTP